jgi:histidine triad (HIT) family protein
VADCKFCRIDPAVTVDETAKCLVFLDYRPVFPGHCLVIPKEHYETLADLPADSIQPLFQEAQRVARAVETALGAEGSFIAINNKVSQSVPHLHVHVVPRRRKDGLKGFFWPRQSYRDEAHMAEVRDLLRDALQRPGS